MVIPRVGARVDDPSLTRAIGLPERFMIKRCTNPRLLPTPVVADSRYP